MDNKRIPLLLLSLSFTIAFISCSNIFEDLLSSSGFEGRDESERQSCSCIGPNCTCCVDFNFTYVDLGGPGCVQMRYISQDEGILLNVSFGERVLHAQHVKGPNPPPTCMPLLKNIAEICARFSTLEKHDDGLKGCMVLEPKVFHDIQTQFDVGCFVMGKEGMKIDSNSTSLQQIFDDVENTTESEADNESQEFSEEDIIKAVSETAQKGLQLFSSFLGIDLDNYGENETKNNATIEQAEISAQAE